MKHVLILSLLCAPVLAEVPKDAVGLHGFSWHSEAGNNNKNPGVYMRMDGWQVGSYKNSKFKKTTYLAMTRDIASAGDLKLGWIAGVGTGYPGWVVMPMAAATVSYGGLRVLYVPKLDSKFASSHVVHFMYEMKY